MFGPHQKKKVFSENPLFVRLLNLHLWACVNCDSRVFYLRLFLKVFASSAHMALKRPRFLVGNRGTGIIRQDSYSCGRIVLTVLLEGKNQI